MKVKENRGILLTALIFSRPYGTHIYSQVPNKCRATLIFRTFFYLQWDAYLIYFYTETLKKLITFIMVYAMFESSQVVTSAYDLMLKV